MSRPPVRLTRRGEMVAEVVTLAFGVAVFWAALWVLFGG